MKTLPGSAGAAWEHIQMIARQYRVFFDLLGHWLHGKYHKEAGVCLASLAKL